MTAKRANPSSDAEWGDEELRRPTGLRLERRGLVDRPYPPETVAADVPERFEPAPVFAEWIRDTFLLGSGPLSNEDHEHLVDARLGVLWTNAINVTKQRTVMATAEIPNAMAGGWKRARFEFQLRQWFGAMPDFVLTFSAPECEQLDDRAFCALVEHELYHCAQALDHFGTPKFHRETGLPVYTIRGHDVEEFTGVVSRYGATSEDVRAMVRAANRAPLIAGDTIAIACGTCAARAA